MQKLPTTQEKNIKYVCVLDSSSWVLDPQFASIFPQEALGSCFKRSKIDYKVDHVFLSFGEVERSSSEKHVGYFDDMGNYTTQSYRDSIIRILFYRARISFNYHMFSFTAQIWAIVIWFFLALLVFGLDSTCCWFPVRELPLSWHHISIRYFWIHDMYIYIYRCICSTSILENSNPTSKKRARQVILGSYFKKTDWCSGGN